MLTVAVLVGVLRVKGPRSVLATRLEPLLQHAVGLDGKFFKIDCSGAPAYVCSHARPPDEVKFD